MRMTYASAAAMVALASSTHAANFDGFYVGAQVGHDSTDIKVSENWSPATYDGFSATGADYGVYAGYGHTFDSHLHLGLEVEGNLSTADNTITTATDTLKTEKEHAYGAALRAGYVADTVMPYVRVGYTSAKFKQALSGTLSASGDETESGLAYGAGLEWALSDRIAARAEFVRTAYGKIRQTDGTNTITYDPTETVARVGVSVRF
ncbi:MAG: outer membrane protein [Bradyrhizobium sp.]|uniref:outer membrane protein n=1 Tax=Bradyrhizobium sp. TaxID=376 RepID=UPI003D12E7DD